MSPSTLLRRRQSDCLLIAVSRSLSIYLCKCEQIYEWVLKMSRPSHLPKPVKMPKSQILRKGNFYYILVSISLYIYISMRSVQPASAEQPSKIWADEQTLDLVERAYYGIVEFSLDPHN